MALRPRDPAALEQAAAAVSDPQSPTYHHYLPKGAFAAAFGPTAATINAVKSVLVASHLTVTSVSSNHLLVHFTGTVGSAQAAFRTRIANVRLANGRSGTETTTPLSFPASIAPQVTGVIGLDSVVRPSTSVQRSNGPSPVKAVTHPISHSRGAPAPCPAATAIAQQNGGLTDDQIAHAYGLDGLYSAGDLGAGQTVAIYELEPFAMSDVSTFDACYFGAAKAARMVSRVHTISVDGGVGTGSGEGESILDIEDVEAVAPNATVDVYEAPNTNAGAMDEFDQIVADDTAQVVTSSWGYCELDQINLEPGYINVENDVFEQAALQGQTVLNSSGDTGSDECAYDALTPVAPVISQSDPASQPFVLGVGGTTMTNASDPPVEQVWNDGSYGGASGGGPSSVWGAPSWQQPFVAGADKAAAATAVTQDDLAPCKQSADASLCREAPDVSADADEDVGGITTYQAAFGGWWTSGGTSSSSPLWAAILAEINASQPCKSSGPTGFVSPGLYAVAAIPAEYKASFNDVTKGNNDDYDIAGGAAFEAGPGFDMATGLGTPRVTDPGGKAGLAAYLCGLSAPTAPRPAITALSSPTEPAVPSGSLTITGSGFEGAKSVSIDAYAVPAADWSVTDDSTIVISPVPTAAQAGTGSFGPQDGTGRAIVSVTGSGGATSLPNPASTLLYVDGTSGSPIPSVGGISAYGGPQAGGNTVTVFGSDFTTSGADAITGVTVGGVAATSFSVTNESTMSVVIPPYQSGTTTCAVDDDPAHDVCQAQVVVSNANGSSTPATIRPPYIGEDFTGLSGDVPLPDCVTDLSCEVAAAVSEYDYLPTPTITSVTTTSAGDATTWASENGTTIATVKGSGFDFLGLEYTNVGNPNLNVNQDYTLLDISPTQFQVVINPRNSSHTPVTASFTVQTLGGLSASWPIRYAAVPAITSVSPALGPDTGGTHMTVTGTGFDGASPADGGRLFFAYPGFDTPTTQATGYSVVSDTTVKDTTPGNDAARYRVRVCTITACSTATTPAAADFDFYPLGAPKVTSLSVRSGPAAGGTRVVLHGQNLSDPVRVTFGGSVAALTIVPVGATNDGSSSELDAVAPPGKAGSKVAVRVTTVESRATGSPPSASSAATTFSYSPSVASAPRGVTATVHGRSLTVKWKAPVSTGGHAITAYRVAAIAAPAVGVATPPAVVVVTAHGSARTATLHGLRPGSAYRIRVRAITSKGRGLAGQGTGLLVIHR